MWSSVVEVFLFCPVWWLPGRTPPPPRDANNLVMSKPDQNSEPSPNGSNGRGAGGKFAKGWKGGPGNPHAKRVAELRAILLGAVKDEDFKAITQTLIKQSTSGDMVAMRELFQRTLGPPVEIDLIERLEALEAKLAALQTQPR